MPLLPEIEPQITVDKSKTGTQTGSKSPQTRAQAMTEGDKDGKEASKGNSTVRKKRSKTNPSRMKDLPEEEEDENDKVKNRGNHPMIRRNRT